MIRPFLPVRQTLFCYGIALPWLLLTGGCSWPNIHIVEQTAPPFVQTDNLDAPRPQGNPSLRTRKLFLGVVAALRQQGRASAALAFLDDYDRSYPHDPLAMLLRADCLLDLDQPGVAEPIYRRLLDGPQEASAHAGLGQAAAIDNRWTEAARDFALAAALAPSDVRYLNNQGYALLRAGDTVQAEFVLRKAAQLDPANPQTRNNLILCLQRQGKPVPQPMNLTVAPVLPIAGLAAGVGKGGLSGTLAVASGTARDIVSANASGAGVGMSDVTLRAAAAPATTKAGE